MRALVITYAILVAACGGPPAASTGGNPDPLAHVSAQELYERGVALGRAGDFVRAEQYLAASIERGYSEDEAVPVLVAACVQSSRLSSALRYAEPYLAQHPTNWSLRMLIAMIRMGLGSAEAARDELDRVLRDAPSEPPEAHYFLGVIYRDRLPDAEAAREHFRRYVALAPEGEHAEEARAALPPEEGGPPVRIESPDAMPERVEPQAVPSAVEPSAGRRQVVPSAVEPSAGRPQVVPSAVEAAP